MTRLLILLTGLLALPALAASGTMIKDEDLKAGPKAGAATVLRVKKGSEVEVLARQAGWTQVRSGGKTGWVRILSVKSNVSTASAADLAALASRRDPGKVVAVAGLRGLNEEELKAAKFDAKELTALEHYQVDRAGAEQFARSAGLGRRQVAHLPAPQAEAKPNDSPWGESGL